jgi:hypothetical protein
MGRLSDSAARSQELRTVHLRWRGVAAALPALALLGGGLTLAGSAAPEGHARGANAAATNGATLPIVPDAPYAFPGTAEGAGGLAPGLDLPPTAPGSAPVTLDAQGVPGVALAAYHKAAGVIGNADPSCHIDWALIAAIGRVESDHGRYGGNVLDSNGIARPGIYGVPLDGTGGTSSIPDTDNGVYDHDPVWDRAVGPMQFIPGTWRTVGGDLDGDGVKNPQDINDAAAATAIYLCAGPGNLADPSDAYAAVRRYNNSDSYARTVLAIADAYRRGVTMLPMSDLPAAARNDKPASTPKEKPAHRGSTGQGGTAATPAGTPTGTSTAGTGRGGGGPDPETSGGYPLPPLPGPVATAVCPIVGGLPLPPLPVPVPGCPTPTPTP